MLFMTNKNRNNNVEKDSIEFEKNLEEIRKSLEETEERKK